MRPHAPVVLAALALTLAPPAASSLRACPELAIVEAAPVSVGGGSATYGVPGCPTESTLLVASKVIVRWSHDEPGVEGLAVVLEGAGVDPTPLPMVEQRYVDVPGGLRERTHYESPVVYFASPSGGSLTATLHRDGVPVEAARATALA